MSRIWAPDYLGSNSCSDMTFSKLPPFFVPQYSMFKKATEVLTSKAYCEN